MSSFDGDPQRSVLRTPFGALGGMLAAFSLIPFLLGLLGISLDNEVALHGFSAGASVLTLAFLRGSLLTIHVVTLLGVVLSMRMARDTSSKRGGTEIRMLAWCCALCTFGAFAEVLSVSRFVYAFEVFTQAVQTDAITWLWSRALCVIGGVGLVWQMHRKSPLRSLHVALLVLVTGGLFLILITLLTHPQLVLPPAWDVRLFELIPLLGFLSLIGLSTFSSPQSALSHESLWVVWAPFALAQIHILLARHEVFGHHANSARVLALFGSCLWFVWVFSCLWNLSAQAHESLPPLTPSEESGEEDPKPSPGVLTALTSSEQVMGPPKTDLLESGSTDTSLESLVELKSALHTAKLRVQKTEQRVDAIIENIPVLIFLTDAFGRFVFCDGKVEQLFGYNTTDLVGRHALTIVGDSAEDLGRLHHVIRKSIHGEESSAQVESNGTHFEVRAAPMRNSTGEVLGAVGVVLDITERVEAEMIRNEFTSIVSHELRTPLTSIRGSLGLLSGLVEDAFSPQARTLIEIAESNTLRLIRLVNDLLDLSKLETGKLEIFCSAVPVQSVARDAVQSIAGLAQRHDIQLVVDIDPRCGAVHADKDRLIQILVNLLSNAVKYSKPHDEVVLRAYPSGPREIRFEVHDKGPGISLEAQERIFEKFEQADASDTRAKAGTGLGLAIVRSLVEQHGGTLGVHSEPPHGAMFFVHIPISEALSESMKMKRKTPRSILMIREKYDTDTFSADLEELMTQGFQVEICKDPEDSALFLKKHSAQAVLVHTSLWDPSLHVEHPTLFSTRLTFVRGIEERSTALPYLYPISGAVSARACVGQITAHLRPPGPLRVLIADDDDLIRRLVRAQLSSVEATWFEATDGMKALEIAQESQPDLIVLDVNMPRASGFDLVRVLRKSATNTARVLVHTARDLNSEERDKLRLGRTAFFFKARNDPQTFMEVFHGLISDLLPLCTPNEPPESP